jgi:hypothetical protein
MRPRAVRGRPEQTPVIAVLSGPSRHWTKTKCANWKRDNAERCRLFEVPKKSELQALGLDLRRIVSPEMFSPGRGREHVAHGHRRLFTTIRTGRGDYQAWRGHHPLGNGNGTPWILTSN